MWPHARTCTWLYQLLVKINYDTYFKYIWYTMKWLLSSLRMCSQSLWCRRSLGQSWTKLFWTKLPLTKARVRGASGCGLGTRAVVWLFAGLWTRIAPCASSDPSWTREGRFGGARIFCLAGLGRWLCAPGCTGASASGALRGLGGDRLLLSQ